MNMVQQTPDGKFIVRSNASSKDYIDTFENAALDFGVPTPTMAPGATDRVYEPGVRHAMTDTETIIAGGPMPWTAGDNYITNIATGLANQTARNPPPHTLRKPSDAQLNTEDGSNNGGSSA